MSTEIVQHQAGTTVEKIEWARAMAPSNLLPRQFQGNPANLLYAVEYADSLGIERINAITSIHVIEGKPTASADLIAGMARRAGHRLRVSGDDSRAVAELIRADDPEFVYRAEWTLDKAKSAGLTGKGVWKNYPGAMLRSRAITEVCRMGASDALLGVVYTPEEMGAEVDAQGAPTRPSAPVPSAPRQALREALGNRAPMEVTPDPEEPAALAHMPAEDAPQDEDAITAPQQKKMGALMREAGITERDHALSFVSQTIGRVVGSRSELTKDEAGKVIDALEADSAQQGGED